MSPRISNEELIDEIEDGNAQKVLNKIDLDTVKTLLNVIRNVIDNPSFKDKITSEHKKVLNMYRNTFAKLMDDQINLRQKRKLLQKDGEAYLPTFLDIIGSDLDDFTPRKINRTRRDCPLCNAVDLKRLPQHLSQQHGLSSKEKQKYLRKV